MTYYMGWHTLPGFSREVPSQATPALDALTNSGQGPRFIRALSSFSEGRVVCEFEAPSKEVLADTYAKLGFPFDAIIEVDAVCDTGTGHVVTTEV